MASLDRFSVGVEPSVAIELGGCSGCGGVMYQYELTTCPACGAQVHQGCLVKCQQCGAHGCRTCLVQDKETLDWRCEEDCWMATDFDELHESIKAERSERRRVAQGHFQLATDLAAGHGMELRQHSKVHYQLIRTIGREILWIMNIYPGNQRLYGDANRRGPYLHVPDEWTLLDVVKAAIRTIEKENGHDN